MTQLCVKDGIVVVMSFRYPMQQHSPKNDINRQARRFCEVIDE